MSELEPEKLTVSAVGLYLLCFMFGFFPFLIINAIFAELPVFIDEAPEGKRIGALLGTAFQIANITPFVYIFCQEHFRIRDRIAVPALSLLGVLDAVLLIALWNKHVPIGGSETSFWLLFCTFLSGVVGCTGVVVLFGYVSSYRMLYLSAVSSGLAGSGLVSALVALSQGTGTATLRFSVGAYFGVVTILMAVSFVSFFLVDWSRVKRRLMMLPFHALFASAAAAEFGQSGDTAAARRASDAEEMLPPDAAPESRPPPQAASTESAALLSPSSEDSAVFPASASSSLSSAAAAAVGAGVNVKKATVPRVFRDAKYPFSAIFCASFMCYFIVPGLEPFLSADSGIVLWAANAFLVGNVLGRNITAVAPSFRLYPLNFFMLVQSVLLVASAATSGRMFGILEFFVPVLVFIFSATAGYTNTMVYAYIQKEFPRTQAAIHDVDRLSRWASIMNQVGALLGTFASLVLVEAGLFR